MLLYQVTGCTVTARCQPHNDECFAGARYLLPRPLASAKNFRGAFQVGALGTGHGPAGHVSGTRQWSVVSAWAQDCYQSRWPAHMMLHASDLRSRGVATLLIDGYMLPGTAPAGRRVFISYEPVTGPALSAESAGLSAPRGSSLEAAHYVLLQACCYLESRCYQCDRREQQHALAAACFSW